MVTKNGITECFCTVIFFIWEFSGAAFGQSNVAKSSTIQRVAPELAITYVHPKQVITNKSDGAKDIAYGFEGGPVVKIGNTYHLFTSEMYKAPIWVNMRLGHWISTDKVNWKRVATIRQSSGDYTGKDERAALWSPLPVWDADNKEWNLFYVCYKSAINTPGKFLANHDGRIQRSVSKTKGIEGIGGPYEDHEIVMKPGSESQAWEGLQGVDSFFPWIVAGKWYAFYGTAKTETKPIEYWRVGMATAPSLTGKWKRDPKNPSNVETHFIENPIVDKIDGKGWFMLYDHEAPGVFGWAYSKDGINWGKGHNLKINDAEKGWCKDIRTPMGLIDEGNGKFTMFYTGFEENPDWDKMQTGTGTFSCAIGYIELEIK